MSSTIPQEAGKCIKCGNTIYIGLAHSCSTAVNFPRAAEPAPEVTEEERKLAVLVLHTDMGNLGAVQAAETLAFHFRHGRKAGR